MSVEFKISVSEDAVEASGAIDELLKRRFGGRPIAEYAYGAQDGWDELAEGGWDLVGVAEADGGVGIDIRDLIVVGKTVGHWLPPMPLLESIMAKRWSSAARDSEAPVTVAIRTESGRVLVPFGGMAGIQVLADGSESGGVVAPGAVTDDDYAPSLRLVISAGEPTSFSTEQARELAIVWAAEAVGCAERMLDLAVDYVKQRQQFGQPVGRFQAVKHHLANALISSQEAESAVIWGAADAPLLAPALEVAFDSALRTAEIAVQAHGGIGFTWELGLHVYLRQIVTLRELAMALAAVVDER